MHFGGIHCTSRRIAATVVWTTASTLLVLFPSVPATAVLQEGSFECTPARHNADVGHQVTISCDLDKPPRGTTAINGGYPQAPRTFEIQAEILPGSVNDDDGMSAPPDAENETDEEWDVAFTFISEREGTDVLCIWPDYDGDVTNIDEGGRCTDGEFTEVVQVTWAGDPAAPPSHGAPPPIDDDDLGLVLLADRDLSLAVDVLLVTLFCLAWWRSSWIRAVVGDSVRHPRTATRVERDGGSAFVRPAADDSSHGDT
ncbi:MAG: hypothetical protein M3271_01580 [Actinomycetota bacterium]|nr:hypothetical protein [Actinomycetota bacterium]